jgi:very-short-patch-repair endonuclease
MGEKSANPDAVVARLAAQQHGVVSTRQLQALGLGRNAVGGRLRSGRLHRVHRGVYAVGHRGISQEGRCMAAVLACGSGMIAVHATTVLDQWAAVVSHRSAASLWGLLPDGEGSVDVSILGPGGRRKRAGIRLHRSLSLSPASATLHRAVPVTTPARTISDLRRSARDRRCAVSAGDLRRAIRQAEVLGLPIGSEAVGDRTRSELERTFLRLCRGHRLPRPEVNVRIGPFIVDFLWRDRMLIVETDGYRFHRGHSAFEHDRDRDLALRTLGYEVIRLSQRQVVEEPQQVADALQELLREASAGRVGGRG